MQYLSCCPAFRPAGAEDSLPLVQDKEGTLGLQLTVLLPNQAEGGRQVGDHHQARVDMPGDSPLLVAEEDMQDNPVVVQALGIPGQAAWDRAGLLAAWALHRQEVVH